ncbi:MAG: hypothetical protein HYY29_04190 [Chloroflexi bacterium]|nr:hypothetical protein [Chloroflexota bacterium]
MAAQVLNVYIARHCFGTTEAIRLAEDARQNLPDISVRLTAIEDIPEADRIPIPATPAYFLDGRLLFLGNPRIEELLAKIASCNGTEGHDHG